MKKVLVLIAMAGLGFLIAWVVSDDHSQQKAESESLKAEVQQLTTAIGKTEIERDTLKVRMALAEKNRDELKEQVDALTELRNKLQEQVEEFSFSRDQSQQQFAEIIVTRDNLKKQFAELAGSRDNMQQQLDELAASRNQLRRKVGELTMSSNAAIADVQTAQKRIEKLVAMLEGETQKPAEPQAELNVINQEAEDIQPPMIEVDRRPALHSFDSNRLRIMPGQTSTLSWQVSNAARIRIEPEVGPVTALGSRTVKPSAATTYTLIAANNAGESRKTCRVEVGKAPTVQSQAIEKPAVLTEVVEPPVVTRQAVEPAAVSSKTVEPAAVSSKAGERPTCHSFNTNRPLIMPGQASTLSWQVSNAARIRIEPEVGPVTALGSRTVKPSAATTYTLIAANNAGESRKTCRVEVGKAPAVQSQAIEKPAVVTEVVEPPVVASRAVEPAAASSEVSELPTVHSFNTTRPVIMPGQTSTLSWQVSNAEKIRIEPEVGPVSALGSRTVKPSATTTYNLIATNRAGDSKLSQKVEVSERINIFSSDSIDSRALLEEYKASHDSKVLPGQKLPASDPNAKQGKFLGYRARKDESGKFIFIPVYENQEE